MRKTLLWLALASVSGLAHSAALAQDGPGQHGAEGAPVDPAALSPKSASSPTKAVQAKARAALPHDDGSDEKFANQGFIASLNDPVIRDGEGKAVWNLEAYAWMGGDAPATVNPSLWRHQKLLRKHGLFKLTDRMWQVRGFDLANMTVIQGDSGWILIDPLTTRETAKAALDLVNAQLGERPVKAVIYSHSHVDHFGGVRGVASDQAIASGQLTII
nr:MBL fold metallo-hydrolase [Sphingorhabdus sp.]